MRSIGQENLWLRHSARADTSLSHSFLYTNWPHLFTDLSLRFAQIKFECFRYVWPWAKRDAMQHDSYLCRKYSGKSAVCLHFEKITSCCLFTGTSPFPIQRKNETNNFVAAVVAENQYIWKKCPEKCRPQNHKDWEYC